METFWILLTGSLVASGCGFIGCFLILRRMALLGDAVSHAVLPGLVVAFLLTERLGTLPMLIGAAATGLLTAFAVQWLHQHQVQEDAAVGVTFTSLFALGVVLLSFFAGDVHLDTEHVLFGEIAYVPWNTWEVAGVGLGPRAVWTMGGVFLLTLAVVGFAFKEFKLSAFDPALAAALGIPVTLLHYVQMSLVSLTAVAAFESVGAILAVAMLIVPGATAYLLTHGLVQMLAGSVVIGVLSAVGGYYLAVPFDVSIAGSMAVVAGILFTTALLFSPSQGVITQRLQQRKLRRLPDGV